MVKPARSAAIYLRISSDTDGLGLGVARQLSHCQRLAGQLGWTIGQVYEDNDVSAWKGGRRPRYEQLLADIRDGLRDAVLIYHLDRARRGPRPRGAQQRPHRSDGGRVRNLYGDTLLRAGPLHPRGDNTGFYGLETHTAGGPCQSGTLR